MAWYGTVPGRASRHIKCKWQSRTLMCASLFHAVIIITAYGYGLLPWRATARRLHISPILWVIPKEAEATREWQWHWRTVAEDRSLSPSISHFLLITLLTTFTWRMVFFPYKFKMGAHWVRTQSTADNCPCAPLSIWTIVIDDGTFSCAHNSHSLPFTLFHSSLLSMPTWRNRHLVRKHMFLQLLPLLGQLALRS